MKMKGLIAILIAVATLTMASAYLVACGHADGNGVGGYTLTIKGAAQ